MSPNEFQLRAALREGEGDGVDVDAVLAGAAEIRRRRRRALSSISGGVAVAALIGVGGTLIATNTGGGESGGGGNVAASLNSGAATAPARGGGGSQRMLPNDGKGSRAVGPLARGGSSGSSGSCPARPAQIALPADGGRAEQLPIFDGQVSRITVCAYEDQARGPAKVLVAPQATAFAAGVNGTVSASAPSRCNRPASLPLELFAVASDGTSLDPVLVSFGCGSHDTTITNGTAVRYQWNPPPWVLRVLDARVGVPPSK